MKNPEISVIVAAYNVENYLERCLQSLISQTLKNIEIIVVDDCSTDRTNEIASAFAETDERIHVISKAINEGLSMARNTGIENATGDYIVFVDGDDYVANDAYEKIYKFATLNSCDEVVFASRYQKNDGTFIAMPVSDVPRFFENQNNPLPFLKKEIGSLPDAVSDYDIGFTPWGRVYRRNIIVENGLKFTSERVLIYEDILFTLDAAKYFKKAGILNEELYYYCENANSLTKKIDTSRFSRIRKEYLHILQEKAYAEFLKDEEFVLRLNRTFISYIRLSVMQLANVSDGKKVIREICNDSVTRKIMAQYPVNRLPLKQRMFAYLLKNRHSYLLYQLTRMYMKKEA